MFQNELKFMEKFDTIAIAPHYNEVHTSQIFAHQGTINSEKNVTDIMDQYCIFHGADLNGRIKAARKRLGVRKSPPVIISEALDLVAFQVPVAYYKEPMWILDLEFEIHPMSTKNCEIHFKTDLKFEIPLSEEALKARKNKTSLLLYEFKYAINRKRLQV